MKWAARAIALLTMIACMLMLRFPAMKEWAAAEKQRHEEEEAEKEAVLTAQIEALMERRTRKAEASSAEDGSESVQRYSGTISEEEGRENELRIELPPEVSQLQVRVTNEYVKHLIRVSFPSEIEDYFSMYHVQGSSDGIEDMIYYKRGGQGVIELKTRTAAEVLIERAQGSILLELVDPHVFYEKVVVIDAGHGGEEKIGAVRSGVEEKNLNLGIVGQLKRIFDSRKEDSVGVYYTRLQDEDVSLEQRVGLANELGADLFISVHNNTTVNETTRLNGTQVLFQEADMSAHSSRRLAQICLEEVSESLNSNSIGLLKGDDIYIIKNSQMPVALIEVGFMSNPSELKRLVTDDYQKKAAEGIYNAVERALDEGF